MKKKDVFCKISNNELQNYKVFENDNILAFLDIEPFSEGHTIIIPKKHFNDIEDINDEVLSDIMIVSKKISKALKNIFNYDGIIIHHVSGEKMQDIRHFHVHVYGKNIVAHQNNLHLKKDYSSKDKQNALKDIAEKIKKKLNMIAMDKSY